MKLLFCKNCQDVIRLVQEEKRTCSCGKVSGRYINDLDAIYSGKEAIPIGFANSSFAHAIANQPEKDWGKEFTAFVIQKKCNTFAKVRNVK
jgi:hypothetical protein